jgi:hypothetical protein
MREFAADSTWQGGTIITEGYSSFRVLGNFAIVVVFSLLLLGTTSTNGRADEPTGLRQPTWTDAHTNGLVLNLWMPDTAITQKPKLNDDQLWAVAFQAKVLELICA